MIEFDWGNAIWGIICYGFGYLYFAYDRRRKSICPSKIRTSEGYFDTLIDYERHIKKKYAKLNKDVQK